MTQATQLAELKTQVASQAREIQELRKDVKEILETLNSLTGGKQALMWVTGVAISIFALIIGFLNLTKNK